MDNPYHWCPACAAGILRGPRRQREPQRRGLGGHQLLSSASDKGHRGCCEAEAILLYRERVPPSQVALPSLGAGPPRSGSDRVHLVLLRAPDADRESLGCSHCSASEAGPRRNEGRGCKGFSVGTSSHSSAGRWGAELVRTSQGCTEEGREGGGGVRKSRAWNKVWKEIEGTPFLSCTGMSDVWTEHYFMQPCSHSPLPLLPPLPALPPVGTSH